MSDNSMDSGQNTAGNQETPSPEFQAGNDAQRNSSGSQDESLKDTVKAVLADMGLTNIDERIERGIQSTKDRRFAQQEKLSGRVGELEQQIQQYQSLRDSGSSHEDAMWRMQVNELLNRQQTTPNETPASNGGTIDREYVIIQNHMLKAAGVPENDADVIAYAKSREFRNAAEYLEGLSGLLEQKRQGSSGTGGALNVGGSFSQPAGGGGTDELRRQYEEQLAKIRPGNAKALTDLKAEFRRLGYDRNTDPSLQQINRR